MRSRFSEAAQRFTDRRRREDEAPRLNVQVPNLATLRLEVEERRATAVTEEAKHVRLVVVDNAPALFFIPCGDPECRDGGHDATSRILRELNGGAKSFIVEDACRGTVGNAECARVMRVLATATYR
jgi:hypothetical protein